MVQCEDVMKTGSKKRYKKSFTNKVSKMLESILPILRKEGIASFTDEAMTHFDLEGTEFEEVADIFRQNGYYSVGGLYPDSPYRSRYSGMYCTYCVIVATRPIKDEEFYAYV